MRVAQPIHALTALRGAAAWWVVLYHVRELFPTGTPAFLQDAASKGYLAVDLFFQLSGFVIALNYSRRFDSWSVRNNVDFYLLRLARIYPLHLCMMVLFLVNPIAIALFSSRHLGQDRYGIGYYIESLLLIQNWGFSDDLAWNIPAWSISTEWAAYLLFPFLSSLLSSIYRNRFGVIGAIIVLLVALAIPPLVNGGDLGSDIAHRGLVRCIVGFQLGVFLYRLNGLYASDRRHRSDIAAIAALACFGAYAALPVADYVVVPAGLFLLIYALTDPGSVPSILLRPRVLARVGEVSYSTYLVHYFVKDWVKFVLVGSGVPEAVPIIVYLSCTAGASVLLYRYVERPGQRAARRWLQRGSRPRSAES